MTLSDSNFILCCDQWGQFAFCQIDPIEYVEDICENMQLFPKEDFLTGDQLMFEFNADVSSSEVSDFMVLF